MKRTKNLWKFERNIKAMKCTKMPPEALHLTCKNFCQEVINLLCRLCLQFISLSRQPPQLLLQEINNVTQKRQISKPCFPTREFCISPGQGQTVQKMLRCTIPATRVCKAARQPICTWFCTFVSINILILMPRIILSITPFIGGHENLTTATVSWPSNPNRVRQLFQWAGLVVC